MSESSEAGDELARLEADDELARLRIRNQELEERHEASFGHRAARIGRSLGCTVLIVLGVLSLILSPVVVWGRNLVLDTDRYVQTLEPLARDPGVQQAIITAVQKQVSSHLDVSALVADTLPPKAQVLAAPLQSAVNSLVTSVTTKFVQSDAFHTIWVSVNRLAHQQVDYLLTGKRPANAALHLSDSGQVVLDLAPIVTQVKTQLVNAGLAIASQVPVVGTSIEIADVHGLEKARRLVRILDQVADWLPWIGLLLVAGGIAAARRRRRALVVSMLSVGGGMVVIGIGLIIGRNLYLNGIPPSALPRDTAGTIFDTLVRYLRWGIRLILLVGLLVAFGAWVSGPSRAARSLRGFVVRAPRALGAKLDLGPVGPFVLRYTTALRVAAIGLMLIVLLLVDTPSLGVIILLAVIAVLLLLVIELLRATAAHGRTA